jgi:hypothetical protein
MLAYNVLRKAVFWGATGGVSRGVRRPFAWQYAACGEKMTGWVAGVLIFLLIFAVCEFVFGGTAAVSVKRWFTVWRAAVV